MFSSYYFIEIYYFHIKDEDFYGLSNDILLVSEIFLREFYGFLQHELPTMQ